MLVRHLIRGKRERDAMTDETKEAIKALVEMWEVFTAQVDEREFRLNLRAWNAKYKNHSRIMKLMLEIEGTIVEALQGYRPDECIRALSSGAVANPFENSLERDQYRLWEVAGIQDGIQPEYYEGGQQAYLADRDRRYAEWKEKKNPYFARLLSLQIKYLMESGRPRKDLASIVKTSGLGIEDLQIDLHKSDKAVAEWFNAKAIAPHKHLIEKGEIFSTKKPKGSISPKTAHIIKLAADYPDMTAKELMLKADKKIIGEMKPRTFDNHVSQARTTKP